MNKESNIAIRDYRIFNSLLIYIIYILLKIYIFRAYCALN